MIEQADRVGGACVSEIANVDGVTEHYALGASVLGLMQDFVFEETGLSGRVQTFVPEQPKVVYFPEDKEPAGIVRGPGSGQRHPTAPERADPDAPQNRRVWAAVRACEHRTRLPERQFQG